MRWESVDSAWIYRSSDAEQYSSDISSALLVDAQGVLPASLPTLIEPTDALAAIDATLAVPEVAHKEAATERRTSAAAMREAATGTPTAKAPHRRAPP